MTYYIGELQEYAKAEHERHAAETKAAELVEVEAAEARLAPLSERLGRLLATLPDSVRTRGLRIPELQASLRGRQGRQAHQGEIAAALRKHGWASRRSWKAGCSHENRWYPPRSATSKPRGND